MIFYKWPDISEILSANLQTIRGNKNSSELLCLNRGISLMKGGPPHPTEQYIARYI